MIYPQNFEQKIGFDQIRQLLKEKCLSTLGEESVPETEPPPVQYTAKEKPQRDTVRRKRQEDDYSGLFLRRNEIKTRQCVYISRDVHSKILKIVNDIAGREISVGGYVDTVLRQHLEQHKEKINELYKKQREDLI